MCGTTAVTDRPALPWRRRRLRGASPRWSIGRARWTTVLDEGECPSPSWRPELVCGRKTSMTPKGARRRFRLQSNHTPRGAKKRSSGALLPAVDLSARKIRVPGPVRPRFGEGAGINTHTTSRCKSTVLLYCTACIPLYSRTEVYVSVKGVLAPTGTICVKFP